MQHVIIRIKYYIIIKYYAAMHALNAVAHRRELHASNLMRYRFPYVGVDLRKPGLSQTPGQTARPRLRASVSRNVPVYSPAIAG